MWIAANLLYFMSSTLQYMALTLRRNHSAVHKYSHLRRDRDCKLHLSALGASSPGIVNSFPIHVQKLGSWQPKPGDVPASRRHSNINQEPPPIHQLEGSNHRSSKDNPLHKFCTTISKSHRCASGAHLFFCVSAVVHPMSVSLLLGSGRSSSSYVFHMCCKARNIV